MKSKFPYRLGLDIGTNSIGWCIYLLNERGEPEKIHRTGVRIFSDGREAKTAASLAAARRMKRQMRRRHDRVLKRQGRFMQILIESGLMPADSMERRALSMLDPYELRAKALDHQLSPHELGRALYHLSKRRGFQSSRKDQAEDEKEKGKIDSAITLTRSMMAESGCRTYGEYLAKQHKDRYPVRARSTPDGKGYTHYPQRSMIAEEFDAIWASQMIHHGAVCTTAVKSALRDALLFQRKLRPVEPGTCIFEEAEPRIPQCSPLQQKFRVLQELNNLRIGTTIDQRPLSLEERNILKQHLQENGTSTFPRLKKLLGLHPATHINLESEKRKGLKGDVVNAAFAAENALGKRWWQLDSLQQEALAMLVENAISADELATALKALPNNIAPAGQIIRGDSARVKPYLQALASFPWAIPVSTIPSLLRIRLPEGYASLSRKALEKIVEELESAVITYDEAVRRTPYGSHSDFYTGEMHERLPYYGQLLKSYTAPMPNAANADERKFGRLANPTVHIGLNQVRLIVNEMLRRWGWPEEIVLEVAREFGMSGQRRREIKKEQADNQAKNEKLNEQLRKLGQRENRDNRQRLLLWQELGQEDALDRTCVYTGERLSIHSLFSSEVELDHILPYSRSLDDGLGNKILCKAKANRFKKNRTPFEAFGDSPSGYNWDAIQQRAKVLPSRKAARFRETAISDYINRAGLDTASLKEYGFAETEGFLARHLTDTAYLSRVARRYLTAICPPNKVWVVSGRLTSKLRHQWRLDAILDPEGTGKNRNDHRHHAVDAAIVALCDRSMIQRMSRAAKRAEEAGENRLLERLELPWLGFREEIGESIGKLVVSHRANHSTETALHNDTNYGLISGPDKKGGTSLVVHRVPIETIDTFQKANTIQDTVIKEKLLAAIGQTTGASLKSAVAGFAKATGIRRIRVAERWSVIPIHNRQTGVPYRFVKGDGNYCYDIFEVEGGKWDGEIISSYQANTKIFKAELKSGRKNWKSLSGDPLVMRLRKDDFLIIEDGSSKRIMRIAKFTSGQISMAEHMEANVDSREREKLSGFSYLRKSPNTLKLVRARVVGVDPLGYVNDPGFPE